MEQPILVDSSLLEHPPEDGVIVADLDGNILSLNAAACRLLRLNQLASPQSFFALPFAVFPSLAPRFHCEHIAEFMMINDQLVRVSLNPLYGYDGLPFGVVYLLEMLHTSMPHTPTGLVKILSHELRTPLTVLSGGADLLLRGAKINLDDDQRRLIEAMQRHTQIIATLLNNITTMASLDQGQMDFEPEALDLLEIVNECIRETLPDIRARGLSLIVDVPPLLPPFHGDRNHLKIALYQLLDNARRYTQQGSITLRVSRESEALRIDIADTGRGVSPDLNGHLFTRFARGANQITSSERGAGLGLVIARRLIERHGGKLWLDSTSSTGSTFSLSIPCASRATALGA
jgi:signal transduction histidine kinase